MGPRHSKTLETFCQNESVFRAALYGSVHLIEIAKVAVVLLLFIQLQKNIAQ